MSTKFQALKSEFEPKKAEPAPQWEEEKKRKGEKIKTRKSSESVAAVEHTVPPPLALSSAIDLTQELGYPASYQLGEEKDTVFPFEDNGVQFYASLHPNLEEEAATLWKDFLLAARNARFARKQGQSGIKHIEEEPPQEPAALNSYTIEHEDGTSSIIKRSRKRYELKITNSEVGVKELGLGLHSSNTIKLRLGCRLFYGRIFCNCNLKPFSMTFHLVSPILCLCYSWHSGWFLKLIF